MTDAPYTVGIAMDTWKQPIFERHLKNAGYKYAFHTLTPDMVVAKVATDDMDAVTTLAVEANKEAAKTLDKPSVN